MSTAIPSRSPTGDGNSGVDSTPFLAGRRLVRRTPSLRGAARFLRRASSRRMREPSMRVREAAAEQIEERQSDWAYSRPVVVLDLLWNLAFVGVAAAVLVVSRKESPSVPLRLWIIGYALQCLVHMVCVSVEYSRRRSGGGGGGWWGRLNSNSSSESEAGGVSEDYLPEPHVEDDTSLNGSSVTILVLRNLLQSSSPLGAFLLVWDGVAKHLESANTMFSFIWWIVGFYWVSAGGETLTQDSPQLYWLCITFLAFDVFFVVICVAVACLIGIAVCCCLPCIIAILYAVTDQEGATKEDIERLPKYKFRNIGEFEKQNGEIQESFGGIMTECDTDTPTEHVLSLEDAECCICLCAYEEGTELRVLPCRHHFHCPCIEKWLCINATCPLCKFNILKNGNQSSSEEV